MSNMKNAILITIIAGFVMIGFSGCVTTGPPVYSPQDPSAIFDQALDIVEKWYIDENGKGIKLDVSKRPDIDSLLLQLGPAADLISWKESIRFNNPYRAGIGVGIRAERGGARIAAVNPDSPAAQAGLKPEDVIVMIDGVSIRNRSAMRAMLGLQGPPGSTVNIAVASTGSETKEYKITRKVLDAGLLVGELIVEQNVGYLRIGMFAETTAAEVQSAMKSLQRKSMQGLIIDLRGTFGFPNEPMARTAQLFLKKGAIIGHLIGKTAELSRTFVSDGWTHYTDLPLAILIDEDTSTGAELFAAALHDNGRALLVGQKTAGKSTVQAVFQLKDGSRFSVRSHELKTPLGEKIDERGIVPDVSVELSPAEKVDVFRMVHSHKLWEEGALPKDRQLAAAILGLRSQNTSSARRE